jgi:hypothetical protein
MSGVFQNIDPHPPHRPASVYPPAFGAACGVKTHSLGEEGEGGQYFGRRQTLHALYSTYVSTLWR